MSTPMDDKEGQLSAEVTEVESEDSSLEQESDDTPQGTDATEEIQTVASFTPKQEETIAIISEAIRRSQEVAPPVEMVAVQNEEFEGTYHRRKHWLVMVRAVVLAPLMLAVLCAVLFILGSIIANIIQKLMTMEEVTALHRLLGLIPLDWITLWLPLLMCVAVFFWVLWLSIKDFIPWRYTWLAVTETRVNLKVKIPGVILNAIVSVDDIDESIHRADVRNVKISTNWLAELLGYATVSFETGAQEDKNFHNVQYVSHPDEIAKLFPMR